MKIYEFISNTFAFFIKHNLSWNKRGSIFLQNNVYNVGSFICFNVSPNVVQSQYRRLVPKGKWNWITSNREHPYFCENLGSQEMVIAGKAFTDMPST